MDGDKTGLITLDFTGVDGGVISRCPSEGAASATEITASHGDVPADSAFGELDPTFRPSMSDPSFGWSLIAA